MAFTPAAPEEIESRLAVIRRLRALAYSCILGPVVLIITVVALNRLTNGGMHFLVNGEPWTRIFWFTVVGIFFAGCLVLLISLGRQCPRCGEAFFVRKSYQRRTTRTGSRGGANVFGRRCANCKLPLA